MKKYVFHYRTNFGNACTYLTCARSKREAEKRFANNYPYYRAERITLLK